MKNKEKKEVKIELLEANIVFIPIEKEKHKKDILNNKDILVDFPPFREEK